MRQATTKKRSDTVPLDWGEVYDTNCPLVSASNVDQELLQERWQKITGAKLPTASTSRLG